MSTNKNIIELKNIELEQKYHFRKFCLEFLEEIEHVIRRRKQELLEWLKGFLSYTFIQGYRDEIIVHGVYNDQYQRLGKKKHDISKRLIKKEDKIKIIENYIFNVYNFDKFYTVVYKDIAKHIQKYVNLDLDSELSIDTLTRYYISPILKDKVKKKYIWMFNGEMITPEEAKNIREQKYAEVTQKIQENGEIIDKAIELYKDQSNNISQKEKIKIYEEGWKALIEPTPIPDLPMQYCKTVLKEEYQKGNN